MRKLAFVIIFMVLGGYAFSQQKPHYSQYYQNLSVLNPAVTGKEQAVALRAGFRNQWVGFESAPRTSYFTVSTPVNIGSSQSGFVDYGVSEPGTRSNRQDYLSSASHHGIGLLLLSDKTGPLSRTTFNLTYAYHINISDVANLAVGVGGGINQVGLHTDDLRFKHEGDQVVNSGNIRKFTPDLNAGVYFYASSFFIGASVNQVLNSKLSFAEEYNTGKEEPHYFINTGFRVWFGEDISVAPSVMLKYVNPLPGSYDLNMKVAYRSDVWLGFSWRKKDSVAGMLGFSVSKMVSAGYSYDYTLSNLRNSSSGSHEVVLGLNF